MALGHAPPSLRFDPLSDPLDQREAGFDRGLRWSLLIHGVITLAILIQQLVFPSKVIMIPPSLRVDLVGLPELTKKDLALAPRPTPDKEVMKEIESTPPPDAAKAGATKASEPIVKDEMAIAPKSVTNAKERSNKIKAALTRLKALDRIKQEQDSNATPSRKGSLVKGNVLSAGESASGEISENAQNAYFERIRERIQENWELPVWLSRQTLSAQVQVHIDPRGGLRSFRFMKSSGNPQFDEAVKKALQASVPFPVPPPGLTGAVLTGGVLVGFPL
jgi:TonB family protein